MDFDEAKPRQLHIFFFPFMAPGHTIPAIDMAKLFGMRGIKTTLVTTPQNAPLISKTLETTKELGASINVLTLKFPCAEAGLPEGCESFEAATTPELQRKFFNAITMLDQPLEHLLRDHRPDCLVAETFFPWATNVAAKFNIPRIVSHGSSFFSTCAQECVRLHEPQNTVSSDADPFIISNLPGGIKLTRTQLPDFVRGQTWLSKLYIESKEAEVKSYGVIVNSFYELEPAYADHYRYVLGRKAWHVGPLSLLCNKWTQDKACRGKEASIGEQEILNWLDSKKPKSVVYLCFGSLATLTANQLLEIAKGLEACLEALPWLGFIWVVKNSEEDEFMEQFENKMEGKGLIIRGWAPQVLILDHRAVGSFVTHCGWNSMLEGVCAGLPMVAWPMAAEQFYNEKLITEVLRIGVSVGVKQWTRGVGDSVGKETVEWAVRKVMVGEEAEEMRSRAMELGVMASRAVEDGGSSCRDLDKLIEELRLFRGCCGHDQMVGQFY